jgi:hypothetical protein
MTENYYEKYGRNQQRLQWKTYCDSCHALLGDTAPGKDHLPRENEKSNVCPICKGKIHDPDAPKWSPKIQG